MACSVEHTIRVMGPPRVPALGDRQRPIILDSDPPYDIASIPAGIRAEIANVLQAAQDRWAKEESDRSPSSSSAPKGTDEEAAEDTRSCCICLVNKPKVVAKECGHFSVCFTCVGKGLNKCPVCQTETGFVTLYES